ncbi:MAG: uroporphyrinogen decarboxylase family protein [Kiritimatiellae bacterium]|nr:uroporphyrinogen decarboxylase family protein [Kiritimatiellia bacterium]
MTHRECFQKVMAGERTPWVPNYELGVWPQTIERWYGEGLSKGATHLDRLNMFEGNDLLRLDRRAFATIDISMSPGFDYQVIEEDAEYLVARHSNGIVTKALKAGSIGGARMCMDSYLRHPVTDRASWADMKRRYDPDLAVRYPFWWDEQARLWKDRDYPVCLLGNGSFGLYSQLRSWVGTEDISYMFYDDPALVEEMLEVNTDFLIRLVGRAVRDVQFDYFSFFEDCAGKGGPLFGPELFRKFFMKPYKRIIDFLRKAGIKSFWVDSDGDSEALVPLWMEAGINCFWPLEQASGMDPVRLRKKFGPGLALCGGIDKRELAKGRKAIERELYAKIPPLMESGGYIPHVDHTVPPDVSFPDFMYYMELKRRLIGLG